MARRGLGAEQIVSKLRQIEVLMADCYAAGEMLPPDAARIRKPGRPRKVAT